MFTQTLANHRPKCYDNNLLWQDSWNDLGVIKALLAGRNIANIFGLEHHWNQQILFETVLEPLLEHHLKQLLRTTLSEGKHLCVQHLSMDCNDTLRLDLFISQRNTSDFKTHK